MLRSPGMNPRAPRFLGNHGPSLSFLFAAFVVRQLLCGRIPLPR